MVLPGHVAAHVREDRRWWSRAGGVVSQQHARESAPLGTDIKWGAWRQAVGISRGGATNKVHALADVEDRPVALALTPENMSDITMAIPLQCEMHRPKRLVADKAYDAVDLRRWLKKRRIKALIASRTTRTFAFPLDRKAYKRRNIIECM